MLTLWAESHIAKEVSLEKSISQGKSQSMWHCDLILTHAVTKPSLVTCLEDLKECHPIFMLTATTGLPSPFIQNLSYQAIITVVLRQGFPNWAQKSCPVAVTPEARQRRVFLSELCLCCLFILPWEVLPLIVDCGVKTGSPLSLAHPLPICLNSDKDVHLLAGWKTVKNTIDAFEHMLPAMDALAGPDRHMFYNLPICFLHVTHSSSLLLWDIRTHQWTGTEIWSHVLYFCLFECEELQNRTSDSTFISCDIERILTSVSGLLQWRQLFRSKDRGRENVQVKLISWCLNLCNLNTKFSSSVAIKKAGPFRSPLTLHPLLVLSIHTLKTEMLFLSQWSDSSLQVWKAPRTLLWGLDSVAEEETETEISEAEQILLLDRSLHKH